MTLKELSHAEWETLRQELRAFRGSLLHRAMLAYYADWRATVTPDLESATTDHDRTQFLRGQLVGLRVAENALGELDRKASRIGT